MTYKLFLDDERFPRQVNWVELPSLNDWDWVIVRNYDEFVNTIKEKGLPEFVTFDHDLAFEHYKEGYSGLPPKYDQYKELTGYHCAEWLIYYCIDTGQELPDWQVHSMSPVGKLNIMRAMCGFDRAREIVKGS